MNLEIFWAVCEIKGLTLSLLLVALIKKDPPEASIALGTIIWNVCGEDE